MSSLDKKDGISGDEGQSKRCKVTVQHPEEISDVMNCDDVEKTTPKTFYIGSHLRRSLTAHILSLWLSENSGLSSIPFGNQQQFFFFADKFVGSARIFFNSSIPVLRFSGIVLSLLFQCWAFPE